MPGLPISAGPPGADHDALVRRVGRDAELDAEPPVVPADRGDALAEGLVPLGLASLVDPHLRDDRHHRCLLGNLELVRSVPPADERATLTAGAVLAGGTAGRTVRV